MEALYRAANWTELGLTQGYRRTASGYSTTPESPKRVFIRPLVRNPQVCLTHTDHGSGIGDHQAYSAEASPQRLLEVNRGHWAIESVHYLIDWNFDEDRSRVRTGFGPENLTRLRRFAIGILKSFQKPAQSIAEMMRPSASVPVLSSIVCA